MSPNSRTGRSIRGKVRRVENEAFFLNAPGDAPSGFGPLVFIEIPKAAEKDVIVPVGEAHLLWVETHDASGGSVVVTVLAQADLNIRVHVLGIWKDLHGVMQEGDRLVEIAFGSAEGAVVDEGIFKKDVVAKPIEILRVDDLGVKMDEILNFESV